MTDRWIVIPKWDEFQHYKDRDPKWIKSHRRQYAKDEYLELSFHLRGVLEGLRHSYAASNRQLSDSTLTLTRRLGQRVTKRDLESLNRAGFIEFSSSKPIAVVYQPATPEVRDREEKALSANAPKAEEFATQVAADPKGREHRPYDQPADKTAAIRRLITNGVITDVIELNAELTALGVNGATAESLRALFA